MNARYKNLDNDPRGPDGVGSIWLQMKKEQMVIMKSYHLKQEKSLMFPKGKHWVYSQENMMKLIEENGVWFGKDGNSFPRKKRFLANVMNGRKGDTWWSSD